MITQTKNVDLEINGARFTVTPDGDIFQERRSSTFILDEVRLAASDIFLRDKVHELDLTQRKIWQALRETTNLRGGYWVSRGGI